MSDAAAEPLPPAYDPSRAESYWYPVWEKAGYFRPEARPGGKPFTIVIPPPNVTGSLHMGHALTVTIEDLLTRWQRMRGAAALWLPGTDHAGIATQMVVERELKKNENKTRHDLGREKFLEKVWAWKERSGGRINEQQRVLGCSVDWSRERFTMDDHMSSAVREAFVRLWEDGLMYRTERLINWCPRCHTALSDLEVEHEEGHKGELWEFAYKTADGKGELVVATTRPETMLGDTAVAVHPDDERYKHLVGKNLKHPILGYELPVIGDAVLVDPTFGTGAVKVTPAHDFNDFETGKRHGLVLFNILDIDARVAKSPQVKDGSGPTVQPSAPLKAAVDTTAWAKYAGLSREEARKKVKEDLAGLGLERGKKDHLMALGRCQRCDTVVEPSLSVQWFVKTKPLAEPAIEAVRSGKTRIIPDTWTKTYFHWMENIQDWCISRQLWWGHRIPAWYVVDAAHPEGAPVPADAKPIVSRDKPTVPVGAGQKLVQDPDVLDTWFSSGLWPFATLGWPKADAADVARFYPNSVMETGFDILFFWVARMMMMGCKFMGQPPFPVIYLHAMVRDRHGEKMSKTRGNVIDPLHLIHGCKADEVSSQFKKEFPEGFPAFGADALRFTLAASSASGRDIKLSIERIEGYRGFANKIWNATRFVLMRLEGKTPPSISAVRATLQSADRWILSRLGRASQAVDAALSEYRFADAASAIYAFLWDELCDWYIELVKARLADTEGKVSEADKTAAQATLVHCLDVALRLLHPMMPFITEEIWQKLPLADRAKRPATIMLDAYPGEELAPFVDAAVEREYDLVRAAITGIRTIRAESHVPNKPIAARLGTDLEADQKLLAAHDAEIRSLGRLDKLDIGPRAPSPKDAAMKVLERVEVVVPLAGVVDLGEERARLQKQLEKSEKEHERIVAKLGNAGFVARAPADVVAKDRERAAELLGMVEKLRATLREMPGA